MVEATPEIPHAFAKLVGLTVTERSEGYCKTELLVSDEHMNPNQVVHGAVIYALADSGMGGALTTLLDEGQVCSTIEIKINYFRPALAGRLYCTTRVVNRGRRTAAMESDVFDDKDQLLGRATGTFMITEF